MKFERLEALYNAGNALKQTAQVAEVGSMFPDIDEVKASELD